VHTRSLGSQLGPFFQGTISSAEPGQSDEIDLFVGLDPSSSKVVSASLTSNSRAFTTTKHVFSVEIDRFGTATAIFSPQGPLFGASFLK
jgi:hypothetical protein